MTLFGYHNHIKKKYLGIIHTYEISSPDFVHVVKSELSRREFQEHRDVHTQSKRTDCVCVSSRKFSSDQLYCI